MATAAPGKKISGVYEIVNLVTGDSYVGAASDVRDRQRQHFGRLRRGVHENPWLQREWDEHGERSFAFRVLRKCAPDRVLLDRHELKALTSRDPGKLYNANPTGVTLSGHRRSDEFRRKVGDGSRGRKCSDSTRAKMSAAHSGKQYSLGHVHDEEFRRKRREHMLTNNPNDDPDVRRKKSIAAKAWWSSRRKQVNT